MTTPRRQRFVLGTVAWLLVALVVLAALGSLTAELYFLVSLVGLLVVTELTAPVAVTPRWRRRITWLVLVGLVAFGYVVVRRILAILPPGVLGGLGW